MNMHYWDCVGLSFIPNEWNEFYYSKLMYHKFPDMNIRLKMKIIDKDIFVMFEWDSKVYKTDFDNLDFVIEVEDELENLYIKKQRIRNELDKIQGDFE